jgi:short subunit fatty acids transporter
MFTYGRMEDKRMIISDGYKGLVTWVYGLSYKICLEKERNPMKTVPK